MSDVDGFDLDADPELPQRGRWMIVGALSLLALPVVFSFFLFGMIAAEGCVADCSAPDPRPVQGWAMATGAAVMGGGWAGLVPWAMGRPYAIAQTFVAGSLLVLALFGVVQLVG